MSTTGKHGQMTPLFELVRKEITLELRRKSVLSGLLLYLVGLAFIIYLSFDTRRTRIESNLWSSLFWLAMLFSVVNTVAKSFIGERKGLSIYYYSIASPASIILSKIIYNTLLCFIMSVIGWMVFSMFIGNPVGDNGLFLFSLFLSAWGFAACLSLISGIAAKASHANVLMAVLSFPVLIGILISVIKVTQYNLGGLGWQEAAPALWNLAAINTILTSLAYLLFPYIWRS